MIIISAGLAADSRRRAQLKSAGARMPSDDKTEHLLLHRGGLSAPSSRPGGGGVERWGGGAHRPPTTLTSENDDRRRPLLQVGPRLDLHHKEPEGRVCRRLRGGRPAATLSRGRSSCMGAESAHSSSSTSDTSSLAAGPSSSGTCTSIEAPARTANISASSTIRRSGGRFRRSPNSEGLASTPPPRRPRRRSGRPRSKRRVVVGGNRTSRLSAAAVRGGRSPHAKSVAEMATS
ncbi:unnamed protein product [Prorocentrum cordatum]|uniref:Uncharacterized protein n=1 Tax=Prorocentrum cordatum TaxID=2364126 RepID=A0ABN9QIM5_9DINO|nr:unnamed protein product [Polarella glacialis]